MTCNTFRLVQCNKILFFALHLRLQVSFVSSQGRIKFIRKLYRALSGSTVGRKVATDTFDKYKHRCVSSIVIKIV